jgi:hypothetical protein
MEKLDMRFIIILFIVFSNILSADTIWQDNFEENTGWTLTGEFEIGQPQGLGGEHGNPDPTSAYSGVQVLGVDLTGSGDWEGDYENYLEEDEYSAVSPIIDCSQFMNTQLSFTRWLNVEQPAYDHACLDISSDDGTTWIELWTNSATITDNSWSLDNYDISTSADLHGSVRIRFTIGPTDDSWQYSGWNIDDIEVTGDPVVYGAIEGNVMDITNNEPIQSAQISNQFGNSLSDENGYFLIPNIPTGNRLITVHAVGYYPFTSDQIVVTENDTAYVFCEIIPNPNTPASPQDLTAEVFNENNVHLMWNAPTTRDNLLAYNVYRNGYLLASILPEECDDLNLVNGVYDYYVTGIYDTGESLPSNLVEVEINATGNDEEMITPEVKLWNYPNPFNPSTTIYFEATNLHGSARIEIYNLKGQKVKTLPVILSEVEGSATWFGDNDNGKPVTSGIYLYRLKADNVDISRKCLLLK